MKTFALIRPQVRPLMILFSVAISSTLLSACSDNAYQATPQNQMIPPPGFTPQQQQTNFPQQQNWNQQPQVAYQPNANLMAWCGTADPSRVFHFQCLQYVSRPRCGQRYFYRNRCVDRSEVIVVRESPQVVYETETTVTNNTNSDIIVTRSGPTVTVSTPPTVVVTTPTTTTTTTNPCPCATQTTTTQTTNVDCPCATVPTVVVTPPVNQDVASPTTPVDPLDGSTLTNNKQATQTDVIQNRLLEGDAEDLQLYYSDFDGGTHVRIEGEDARQLYDRMNFIPDGPHLTGSNASVMRKVGPQLLCARRTVKADPSGDSKTESIRKTRRAQKQSEKNLGPEDYVCYIGFNHRDDEKAIPMFNTNIGISKTATGSKLAKSVEKANKENYNGRRSNTAASPSGNLQINVEPCFKDVASFTFSSTGTSSTDDADLQKRMAYDFFANVLDKGSNGEVDLEDCAAQTGYKGRKPKGDVKWGTGLRCIHSTDVINGLYYCQIRFDAKEGILLETDPTTGEFPQGTGSSGKQ